jgi:beta-galactosidase
MAARWERLGVRRLERTVRRVERDGARAVVEAVWRTGGGLAVPHTQALTGFVTAAGGRAVLVEETVELPPELADLARVGTRLEVAAGLEEDWSVEWFGRGPWETYPDRAAGGDVGVFRTSVDAWHTPYLRPQECGGRAGVRWLRLWPGAEDAVPEDAAVVVHLDEPRQVSVSRHHPDELDAATHADELVPRAGLIVHLDAVHRGLGTASCGSDT